MMSAPPLWRCGPHNILKYKPRAHATLDFIPFLEPRFNLHRVDLARDYLEAARAGTRRRGVEVSNYKYWTICSCRFVCTAVEDEGCSEAALGIGVVIPVSAHKCKGAVGAGAEVSERGSAVGSRIRVF